MRHEVSGCALWAAVYAHARTRRGASAVCDAVTAWAFDEGGFNRMQAVVLTRNAGSARVLQKCGYRYEGLLRAYKMVRGTPGDFAMYARLATD